MLQITNRKSLVIWNRWAHIARISQIAVSGRSTCMIRMAWRDLMSIWTSVQVAIRIAMPISCALSHNIKLYKVVHTFSNFGPWYWGQSIWGRKAHQRTHPPETCWTPPREKLLVCSVVDFCSLTPRRVGKCTRRREGPNPFLGGVSFVRFSYSLLFHLPPMAFSANR